MQTGLSLSQPPKHWPRPIWQSRERQAGCFSANRGRARKKVYETWPDRGIVYRSFGGGQISRILTGLPYGTSRRLQILIGEGSRIAMGCPILRGKSGAIKYSCAPEHPS